MGKDAPPLDDLPQTVIERLNGMGRADPLAALRWIVEERRQALLVPLPARRDRRILFTPVFDKGPQGHSGGLHRRRRVDRPQVSGHPLAVFPGDRLQAIANLVHDTQLTPGMPIHGLNGFRSSLESLHTGDETVRSPAGLQLVEHTEPELGALGLTQPPPQPFLLTFQVDAKRQVHRLVTDRAVLA